IVGITEVPAISVVEVDVHLRHADGLTLTGRDNGVGHRVPPVIGDAEHFGRFEAESFDPGKIEQTIPDERAADESTIALLVERRRGLEKDRLLARIVPAGERRLIKLVVAKKSVDPPRRRV